MFATQLSMRVRELEVGGSGAVAVVGCLHPPPFWTWPVLGLIMKTLSSSWGNIVILHTNFEIFDYLAHIQQTKSHTYSVMKYSTQTLTTYQASYGMVLMKICIMTADLNSKCKHHYNQVNLPTHAQLMIANVSIQEGWLGIKNHWTSAVTPYTITIV